MGDRPLGRWRFGLVLIATDPPREFVRVVEMAEDLGFEYIWVCDSSLHARDVYPYLTLCALHTKRARIGVSVTHPFSRHPAVTANAIATVDEIAGGRAILGVGSGDRPQRELGLRPGRVAEVREMVGLVRRLLAGDAVDHRGPTFTVESARLRTGWRSEVPVHLAASGPRMLELAGEVGDGVIARVGLAPESVDYVVAHVGVGATAAGRKVEDLDVGLLVNCCLYRDRARAIQEGRLDTAWYLKTAPKIAEAVGVAAGVAAGVTAAYAGGHLNEAHAAAARVPDQLVQKFVLAGTPDEAVDLVHPLAEKGIRRLEIFALGPDRHQIAREFGERVIPVFR